MATVGSLPTDTMQSKNESDDVVYPRPATCIDEIKSRYVTIRKTSLPRISGPLLPRMRQSGSRATTRAFHVDSRRPPPPHQLSLRSASQSWPAGDPPAPGAPLPHADQELRPQGPAVRALGKLAAGPPPQLARPAALF